MQKTLRWYGLFLLTLLCTVWRAEAQLLTEDFNFTGALTANGWTAHSGSGANVISASATGLTYSGLTSAGNAAAMTTNGEDINRTFTAQTSGSVYASFLLNVSAAQAAGDYFFHLGGNPIGTTFVNRLFAKSAAGGFQLGLSFNSTIPASPVYDPTVYTFGQTYLIVVKYTFVTGAGNDLLTFYVNPGVGVSEPSSGAITAITTTSDAASIASVALRQGSSGSSPTPVVDRIRVGTTWSDVTAGTPSTTPTITASPTALTVTSYAVGGGPAASGNSFVVSGSNLDPASGFVSASAPPNFEISTSSTTGFTNSISNIAYSSSALASTTLYARLVSGLTASTYTGIVTVSGGSATTTVALSGTVNAVAGCPPSGAMSIACARQIGMSLGSGNVNSTQDVSVTGVVTVSSQFGGSTFYIQDNTGGIAVYSGSTAPGLSRSLGETVTVTGKVTYFFGLVEIVNPTITSPASGSAPTAAALTGVSDMTTAAKQGTLVSLSGVTITDTREVFNNKENYNFTTSGGNGQLRMQPDLQDLINSVIPKTALTLTGILDMYDPDDNPATTGDIVYQINPRFNADVPGVTEYVPAGGSTARNTTLDVVAFNLEWLGSTSNGPRNSGSGDATQIANAITALKALDADLYTIPEVVDEAALQSIVDGLSASSGLNTPFTKVCPASSCGSYGTSGNQKVCFVYKNSVFSNVTTTCMNESFGQTSSDWASGRFPFMLSADVTVNGATRAMKFIGIHAKAGDTQSDFTRRQAASNSLHAWLDANNATDRIIILGDLNDDLDQSITRTVAGTAFEPTSYSAFTGAPTKYTAATLTLSQKGFSSTLGFDNMIDHMIVTNEVAPALIANTQYAFSPDVITTANGNFDWLNTLSDHVPVIGRYDISLIADCNFTAGFTQASPLSVCRGSNLTITATGGDTYSWSGPTNAAFTSSGATATITNAANNNDGRYTVSVTKAGCSNTATATISVSVIARPTVSAGSNSPICAGATLNLSAAAGMTNYSWAGPAGATFSSATSSPSWSRTNATTNMDGRYSVTVTATTGCTNSETISAVVNALPNPGAGSNSPVCRGATINLSATAGMTNYSWAGPDGETFSSTVSSPSWTRTGATTAMEGTYTVTVTATTGCTNTGTVRVNVRALPDVNATTNSPVCVGETIQLSAAAGNTNYSWSAPDGVTFSSSTSTPSWTRSNATNAMEGTYSLTVTGSNGCTNSGTVSVRVRSLPSVNPSANNPVCRDAEIQLSAAAGNSNYSWAGPNTFTATEANPTRSGATTAMEGVYSVTVTGTNSCTNSATVSVNVVGLPQNVGASNNANTVNNAICEGAAINLVGSSTSNNITFFWSGPNGYTSSGATPSRTAATVAMAGIYTVTARNNNSCTATASTSVNIKPAPVPSTSANSPCVGETLELSASGGVSYNWIGPDGGTFSTSGSTSTWVRSPATLAMSGSYTVTLVGSNSCTSATTLGVTVRALPVPTIASNSPVCQSGATIRLAAGGGASYNWAGPAGFTSNEAEPSTPSSGFATTANAGVYSVTVMGANSCTATTQTNVQVVSTLTISISASASIPVCQGSSLSLTASGAEAYSWTRRPVGFTSNAVSPTLPYTSTVTFNNIGTANEGAYIVFGQSGSCVTSIEVSVATRNCSTCSIAFSATATPNPVCIGGRIQLTSVVPLPSSPNGTYLWRGPNNFQSSQRNPAISNAGISRSGVYTVTFRPTAAQSCIYTATALVSVINCSGTRIASAEAPAGIQLSASPNPTDGRVKVTIQLETPSVVSLQMSDLLGRSLESWDSGEEQLVHEFDISMEQYKSGMYLLTAEAGQQRAVKKVIKIQK